MVRTDGLLSPIGEGRPLMKEKFDLIILVSFCLILVHLSVRMDALFSVLLLILFLVSILTLACIDFLDESLSQSPISLEIEALFYLLCKRYETLFIYLLPFWAVSAHSYATVKGTTTVVAASIKHQDSIILVSHLAYPLYDEIEICIAFRNNWR